MTINTINESQRTAATVAGLTYLVTLAIVVSAHFGIYGRLVVPGNPAESIRNITAHETLFRINIASYLAYSAGVVLMIAAFYVILEPVSRGLALFAAFFRLVYALMWIVMTLNLFTVLRLLNRFEDFDAEQLTALVRLSLTTGFDGYYVGLFFYAVGSAVFAYLFFKTSYIPRALAAFGIAAYAWCAACSFVLFLFPDFPDMVNLWWFDTPMGLFEIVTAGWLLFIGLRRPGAAVQRVQRLAEGAAV